MASHTASQPPSTQPSLDDTFFQKLFSAIEHISDSVIVFDTNNIIKYVNAAFEKLTGYSRTEAVGQPLRDLLEAGQHPASFHEEIEAALREGKTVRATYTNQRKTGEFYYEEKTLAPLKDSEGNIVSFISTGRDVTHQREAEDDLRASIREAETQAQKYQALMESAPDAIVSVNREGRIALVNAQTEKIFLYTREELLGQAIEVLLPDSLRHNHVQQRKGYIANPHTRPMGMGMDLVARRKDGSEFPVEISLSPLQTEEGLLVTSIIRDITERKQAEELLRKSEEDFRLLVEHTPYGIYRSDAEGNFHMVNRALVEMLGYESEEELLAVNLTTQVYAKPELRTTLIEQYRDQEQFTGVEADWRREDGELIQVRLTGRVIPGDKDTGTILEVVVEDITEQRALEAQFRHSQKMDAIGRLAGGIAHDFNNLLTLVFGYSELLMDQLDPGHPAFSTAEEIQKAANRATSLTQQLLAFSRKQPMQPEILNLNTLVEQMEKMFRRVIGEDILLVTQLDPELGPVEAELSQLEQILLNLAVNARDAMPRGGKLTIQTENVELGDHEALAHPASSPGPYVTMKIEDTGTGMDPETLANIFEPFFTTKEQGKGIGLGLATVYGIVRQNGGFITVNSQPGRGTSFRLFLPRAETPLAPPEEKAKPRTATGGTETILLVEDEDSLRKLAHEFLTISGYNVVQAANGEQALQLVEGNEDPIHLLVTDMVMPRMSGQELAERICSLRPSVKVLYISGYTQTEVFSGTKTIQGAVFLQKPFALDVLSEKIRGLLGHQ